MTDSEKWLVMTALERYAKDMTCAGATSESMGYEELAAHYKKKAMDAKDLMERLNFGEV